MHVSTLNFKFIVLPLLQLRGRVGRSGREGFAYLFYTDKSLLSRVATVSSTVHLIVIDIHYFVSYRFTLCDVESIFGVLYKMLKSQ